jgi:hypothetical protein
MRHGTRWFKSLDVDSFAHGGETLNAEPFRLGIRWVETRTFSYHLDCLGHSQICDKASHLELALTEQDDGITVCQNSQRRSDSAALRLGFEVG